MRCGFAPVRATRVFGFFYLLSREFVVPAGAVRSCGLPLVVGAIAVGPLRCLRVFACDGRDGSRPLRRSEHLSFVCWGAIAVDPYGARVALVHGVCALCVSRCATSVAGCAGACDTFCFAFVLVFLSVLYDVLIFLFSYRAAYRPSFVCRVCAAPTLYNSGALAARAEGGACRRCVCKVPRAAPALYNNGGTLPPVPRRSLQALYGCKD